MKPSQKKVEVLINTRLEPGDKEAIIRMGKPFKTVSKATVAQITWLKPGVNETD